MILVSFLCFVSLDKQRNEKKGTFLEALPQTPNPFCLDTKRIQKSQGCVCLRSKNQRLTAKIYKLVPLGTQTV